MGWCSSGLSKLSVLSLRFRFLLLVIRVDLMTSMPSLMGTIVIASSLFMMDVVPKTLLMDLVVMTSLPLTGVHPLTLTGGSGSGNDVPMERVKK